MKKIVALTSLSATLLSTTVLAACSGDPAPTETIGTPPPSTSASAPTATSAKPSAAPKIPTAATKRTPEGAVAFVKYWFDLANYARMNPAKGIRTKYNAAECQRCKTDETIISQLIAKRAHFTARSLHVDMFKSVRAVGSSAFAMEYELTQSAVSVRGSDGKSLGGPPAKTKLYTATVGWSSSGWKMYRFEPESKA